MKFKYSGKKMPLLLWPETTGYNLGPWKIISIGMRKIAGISQTQSQTHSNM